MPENTRPAGESRSEYVRRRREEAPPYDWETAQKQKECAHLEHGAETVAYRKVNGDLVAYDQCRGCGGRYDEYKVYSRREVPNPEALPLVRDEIYNRPPCEVCGSFGTELHHWAPRQFFDWEADHWPTAYLCRTCHTRWHNTMRAAISYKERQKANVEAARTGEGSGGLSLGPFRGAPR